MNITLDITAALSAVIWPVIVLVILLAFRSRIPMLVDGLGRVKKLEFAGVSLEFARAKPFVPAWSGARCASIGWYDFWPSANSLLSLADSNSF